VNTKIKIIFSEFNFKLYNGISLHFRFSNEFIFQYKITFPKVKGGTSKANI